jgi:hypothetical protein
MLPCSISSKIRIPLGEKAATLLCSSRKATTPKNQASF